MEPGRGPTPEPALELLQRNRVKTELIRPFVSFRGALFLSPAFSCPASPQSWHSSWLLLDGIQTVPSLPTWAYGEPSASKALSFIPPPSSLREASLMPTGKVPPPLYLPLVFDHPQGFCTYVAASSPHLLPVGASKGQGQERGPRGHQQTEY